MSAEGQSRIPLKTIMSTDYLGSLSGGVVGVVLSKGLKVIELELKKNPRNFL